MKTLSGGSLFSGIGGMDKGFEDAGIDVRWQVEIDPFCRKILRKNFPNVKRYADIRKVKSLEDVDVVFGGFPCQPISLAGERYFKKDPRWLWPEFNTVIDSLRPSWVVIENVLGLQTRGLEEVLKGLAASRYDAEWDRLPAAAFGSPQLRYRIFIVAYPGGKQTRWEGPRVFDPRWRDYFRASYLVDSSAFGRRLEKLDARRGFPKAKKKIQDARTGWWESEPDVDRVAARIPRRVDRTRALGNAVVPVVAEWIARQIIAYEEEK